MSNLLEQRPPSYAARNDGLGRRSSDGTQVELAVHDDGRACQKPCRARSSSDSRAATAAEPAWAEPARGGAGLGLSIVQAIVQCPCRAASRVQSRPGDTTFILRLPDRSEPHRRRHRVTTPPTQREPEPESSHEPRYPRTSALRARADPRDHHPDARPRAPLVPRGVWRGNHRDAPWVRPALLGLLVATAGLYLWGLGASGWANSFYSAAAQAGLTRGRPSSSAPPMPPTRSPSTRRRCRCGRWRCRSGCSA